MSPWALILLYHRIADRGCDPWELAVTPEHFDEHLTVLRSCRRVLAFSDVPGAIRRRRFPQGAIVVTFDDGYANNLSTAKPLLEKHGVPAAVFVATGYTDRPEEFWWDEFDRVLLSPNTLPETLSLEIDGHTRHWHLGSAAAYSPASADLHSGWRAWRKDDPTPRHAIYRSLWQLMHHLTENERQRVREQLQRWAGGFPPPRATHRAMASDEIVQLARGGLVEIGAHTVTHPRLSRLSVAAQRDEIQRSKWTLEGIVGAPVVTFAYPFGDYTDDDTVDIVQAAIFWAAATTARGVAKSGSDVFRLPRMHVRDVDGRAFAHSIREWTDA